MGIKIYTGDDRVKISGQIKTELGSFYEVFEGENMASSDLTGIFLGTSLFSVGARKILVKDLSENKELWGEFSEKVEEFLKTDSEVIIWETKLYKRLASTKAIVKAGVEVKEFAMQPVVDPRAVFNILDLSLRDGKKAVAELEKTQGTQDPYMFFGLMVSQALKKLEWKPNGKKERKLVQELAKIDMQMKSTAYEPWMLVKSFLLRAATL